GSAREAVSSLHEPDNAIPGLHCHQGIVLDSPSVRSGMHGGGDSSDFLTCQQSEEVDEMRSDVDRGSTTGKRGVKCPACACSFIAVGRTHNETERHVVEIRRNVPLGIFQGGEQVATPEDERYRAVDARFQQRNFHPCSPSVQYTRSIRYCPP